MRYRILVKHPDGTVDTMVGSAPVHAVERMAKLFATEWPDAAVEHTIYTGAGDPEGNLPDPFEFER